MTGRGRRSAVAGCSLLLAAGLIVSGCSGGSSGTTAAACSAKTGKAVTASSRVAPTGKPAAGWTLPGADLANTRDVASAITSSDVSKLPVGGHEGPGNGGLLTEHATTASAAGLPARFCLEPSIYGGIETQLASNGATTFAAVNDLALPATPADYTGTLTSVVAAVEHATGEMVAVDQDTGTVEWDTPVPSSPYGAATVTNDVVFTTTFHGDLYALDAGTGKILLKTPLSAGTNAPVAVDGDYVIAGAGASLVPSQQRMIIAYKLGATGKLPDTVAS